MAHSVEHLLRKPEDLSSALQTPGKKLGSVADILILVLLGRKRHSGPWGSLSNQSIQISKLQAL